MQNPYSKSQILSTVKDTLARVLGIPVEEIQDDSSMVNDLGAESLDFVELNAILEKTLKLTLPAKSVLDHAAKISGQADRFYTPKGGLTEAGCSLLLHSPYRYRQLRPGMGEYEIFNASAVENVANICHEILEHLPASCPDCGHEQAAVSSAGRPICAACNAALRPAHGDEVLALRVSEYLRRATARDA